MTFCEPCEEWTSFCDCYNPILEPIQTNPGMDGGNPAAEFFTVIFEIYQAFPPVVQALLGMVVLTAVFFGLMLMIRS